jgi:ribosomal-protein-alanine N-acetyltransferase
MIRCDMPAVLAIESSSFEFPSTEEMFIRVLRQRNCIGMVAERDGRIEGFMIYELHKTRIHILSFAVHPDFRREGIGKAMTEKLVSKLAYQRRNRIVLEVRETNLSAQLFFRQLGFRATGVLKDFYEDTPEDAFLMQFRVKQPCGSEVSE